MLSRFNTTRNGWQKHSIFIKQLNNGDVSETITPPKQAKVVICGGGVMGASVAYHLAKLGWATDTVLVEQGRFALY